MKPATINRNEILNQLRQYKPQFENLYGVTKLGIFGSVARDEAHEDSDIDVVVEMNEANLFSLVHMKETLEENFHRPVDVIRYRKMMNERIRARIDREAVYV
jgi:uncharacterized protein